MLEAALAAGVAAAGGDALLGGRAADPGGGDPRQRLGLDLAAVVSASHNPYGDNGIKFFSATGTKLADEVEARIEALRRRRPPPAADPAGSRELNGGLEDYLREPAGGLPSSTSAARTRRPRLRQRRHPPGRAGDLRTARRRGRGDRRSSPTAATSTTAAARPTSRRSPRRSPPPTPRSASPSTATATGCSPSTAPAASTTATS